MSQRIRGPLLSLACFIVLMALPILPATASEPRPSGPRGAGEPVTDTVQAPDPASAGSFQLWAILVVAVVLTIAALALAESVRRHRHHVVVH